MSHGVSFVLTDYNWANYKISAFVCKMGNDIYFTQSLQGIAENICIATISTNIIFFCYYSRAMCLSLYLPKNT
jgi:hypothetical protein